MHLSSLPDVITVNEAEPRGCVCLLVLTQRNEAPVLCNTHTHTHMHNPILYSKHEQQKWETRRGIIFTVRTDFPTMVYEDTGHRIT